MLTPLAEAQNYFGLSVTYFESRKFMTSFYFWFKALNFLLEQIKLCNYKESFKTMLDQVHPK